MKDQNAIQTHYKNFFDIFGFVKIPGFLSEELRWIETEFDKMMEEKFAPIPKDRACFYPQILDNSKVLCDILLMKKLRALMTSILGDNWVYKGSDGNIFTRSTPWHRDYLIRTRTCKMLIYFNESKEDTGALRVIPGTHFVDDSYSAFLGEALTWPEPPVLGGFDEKGFFLPGSNPLAFGENHIIPQSVITTRPGDVIIFNHNIIHCTNAYKSGKRRKLLGLHFSASLGEHPEKTEIAALTRVEMNSAKVERAYGDVIFNHPSDVIQKMIAPLKSLKISQDEKFVGYRDTNSSEAIDFCNRLKNKNHVAKRFEN